ncbi:hypothetical protein AAES_26530 [Amazona aestiva]|uniref:Uncharacterized protein n=1 Tax=Amazona aestiva TaxID=12930 RepID=A0A0Q3WTR3_AMAAE|nr:hypothetical protein AAES_26530 [Amazona aestiva]
METSVRMDTGEIQYITTDLPEASVWRTPDDDDSVLMQPVLYSSRFLLKDLLLVDGKLSEFVAPVQEEHRIAWDSCSSSLRMKS